jgi:hypothetical protein
MKLNPGQWFLVILVGIVLLVAVAVAAWWFWLRPNTNGDIGSYKDASRDALVIATDSYGDVANKIVYLDQGWAPADSMDFYTHTQGSRLIPYSWFLAIEQPGNDQPFREPANMARLRYLPQKANEFNPDGLPVGFVKDPKRAGGEEDWLGLNCAACHTTQINYKQTGYRIDGGPTMGDQVTLLTELTQALNSTVADPAKFDRFAGKVLAKGHTEADKTKLKEQLSNATRCKDSGLRTVPHSFRAACTALRRLLPSLKNP